MSLRVTSYRLWGVLSSKTLNILLISHTSNNENIGKIISNPPTLICESWSKLYGTLLLHQMMRELMSPTSIQTAHSQVYTSLLYPEQIFCDDQNKISNFYSMRSNAATISAFSSRVSQLKKLNSTEQLGARINVTRAEDGGSGSGSGFTVRLLPISWLFRETLSHTLSHLHQQISIPRPQEEIGLECPITQQMLT